MNIPHPNIAAANAALYMPDSFAHEEYRGVNAFVFVNKTGQKQAFRYHLVPERIVHLTPAEAKGKAPNFLIDEVQERLRMARSPFT